MPHLFANAYNVFLLRQYFMTIPRDLDEAALIDGASPFRVFRSVILPLSVPAIIAVSLFHFFFAWNDFFVPLLYLAGKPEIQPLSIAIQHYNALYATQPTLIQAAALMTMAVPVVIFFLAQRFYMRGVVDHRRREVAGHVDPGVHPAAGVVARPRRGLRAGAPAAGRARR